MNPGLPLNEVKGDITEWVQKAEEDYHTAITMLRKRKNKAPDNVCFCAQQCIEKYLKAFLVQHRIYFPKTRLLEDLLDLVVQIDASLEIIRKDLTTLQPYAVDVRYPGFNATVEEAKPNFFFS
jgi:HEPN domain-containing protein